jgi:hypothetical protein
MEYKRDTEIGMAGPGNDDDDVADIDAMMGRVDEPAAKTARDIAALHGVQPTAVFICGRRRVAPCMTEGCGRPHTSLCDFPLTGSLKGKTCDRKMCDRCRVRQPGKNRDYCPVHARLAEERARG